MAAGLRIRRLFCFHRSFTTIADVTSYGLSGHEEIEPFSRHDHASIANLRFLQQRTLARTDKKKAAMVVAASKKRRSMAKLGALELAEKSSLEHPVTRLADELERVRAQVWDTGKEVFQGRVVENGFEETRLLSD